MKNMEILKAARAKIEKPNHWCKYIRHDGEAHCALGAIDAVLGDMCDDHPVTAIVASALTPAERARQPSFGCYGGDAGAVAKFNNASEHSEVLAVFDRAIARQAAIEAIFESAEPSRELAHS